MKTRLSCAIVAELICGAWTEPPRSMPPAPTACRVVHVTDGDTPRCQDGTRVRLRGINMPERGEARYRQARDELSRRTLGRTVTLIPHHRSRDRIVADVMLGGQNVGRDMNRAGWSKATVARG